MNRRQFFKSFGLVGAAVGLAVTPKDILKAAEPKPEFKEVPEYAKPGDIMRTSSFNKMVDAIRDLQEKVKKLS